VVSISRRASGRELRTQLDCFSNTRSSLGAAGSHWSPRGAGKDTLEQSYDRAHYEAMTIRNLTIALCLFGMPLLAQHASRAEERFRMFQGYLVRRAAEITQHNLSDIKTAAQWQQRRPEVRKQLLYM